MAAASAGTLCPDATQGSGVVLMSMSPVPWVSPTPAPCSCDPLTKSFDPDSADEVIKPLSKLVLDRLSRDGMI